MSKLFIEDTSLVAIGDAIRAKTGKSAKLTPAQMATEIGSITTGGGGGGGTFPDIYYLYEGRYSDSIGGTRFNIDVSGGNTLTFKYDYTYGNYPRTAKIEAFLGAKWSANGSTTYTKVDSSSKTETVASGLATKSTTNVSVTLDVTNYTSVAFKITSDAGSSANSNCYVCIHDIQVS